MIKINLLGEKQDNTALHVLQLLVFGSVLVVSVVACFLYDSSVATEIELLADQEELLNVAVKKLRVKTKHVQDLERKRRLLAEKLKTIANLKSKKQGPVRVLDDLTNTIPERAWLIGINQNSNVLEFRGISLDNQTISLFMENLKKSKYFDSIELIYSREYMREGINLQQFSLSARLKSLLNLSTTQKKKIANSDPQTQESGVEVPEEVAPLDEQAES